MKANTLKRAHRPLSLSLAALLFGTVACWTYPQRLPGPLFLPQGETEAAPGAARAATLTLQRDSDPVWVRRPGERGEVPVPFYEKRQRVPVGALVRTGAGGRAELLWSPDASALHLFDEGRVTVGDPERDEPLLRFHSLTRALLVLTPEDKVELLGGALLSGDALETTGPILLEGSRSILRVTNQSKRLATIAFRPQRLELGPGESIDLPILAGGSAPRVEASERIQGPGISVLLAGPVERGDDASGVSLTALASARVVALGVEARLAAGETVRFFRLSRVPPADPIVPP